jgi:protein O-mannosyl-transferase
MTYASQPAFAGFFQSRDRLSNQGRYLAAMYQECPVPKRSPSILDCVQRSHPKSATPTPIAEFLSKPGVLEVIPCAVTAVTYVGTLSFGFVYDDKPVIVDNASIRSWHFLANYFAQHPAATATPSGEIFYRPITLLWLRLNYILFGLNPAGWHFAMLAVHVLATYTVFAIIRKLTNRSSAFIAALLFGLHPVHVENVAWLSSVNDLLMTVLLLGSFLAYLKFRDGGRFWLAASVLLFALALLSKETTAVFPIVILSFALIFARPPLAQKSVWPALKAGFVSIPYFAILATYLVIRRMALHGLVKSITPLSWTTMLLTWPAVLWFDIKHLVFPTFSSEFYSLSYVTPPDIGVLLVPVVLLGATFILVAYYIFKSRSRLGLFALLWVLLTIAPTLYLRAIAPDNFVHDRFLYLPSVGIVLLLALALEDVSKPVVLNLQMLSGNAAPVKWTLVALLGVFAFAATIGYQTQWANNILLYRNGLKYAPQNLVVRDNLANEFVTLGRYDRAIPLYLNALQHDPRFWSSNYNLGYAYYRIGRFSEAEDYLNRAALIDDRDPDQFIFLARAQMEQRKFPLAAQNAERALQRGPLSPGFHFVLARIREASGEREQAIAEYKMEVLYHPENALARSDLQRLQSLQ